MLFLFVLLSLIQNSYASDCVTSNNEEHYCVAITVEGTDNQRLANMVVYLEPLSNQVLPSSAHTITINQHHKAFAPYISVSQTQQAVRFTNQDDITHHIYSVATNNKFSFKIRAGQSHNDITFEHSNEIAMGCNIHDWMSGYLLVVDTPYFAKSDVQGKSVFTSVKQGKYRVVIWHPQLKTHNNRFVIEKNVQGDMTFSVSLEAKLDKIPPQKSNDDFDFLSDY